MAQQPCVLITPFQFLLWVLPVALGILFLYELLSRLFKMPVSLLTPFLVIFGTNYFWLMFFAGPTANACLFTLFLAMILLTDWWQKEMRWIPLVLMLPVMFLVSFFSATGMFILLFPIFAGIRYTGYSMHEADAGDTVKFTSGKTARQLFFLAGIFLACFAMRKFSWFTGPGADFYFGDAAKAQFPANPANIHRVLFSVKNGWLVYSPLMIFALAGFYFLAGKNRVLFYASFLFFLASLVFAACNPAWLFDDRFGYPNLVETYAVLSIPLGYFVQCAWNRNRRIRIFLLLFSGLLVSLNLFQTWQFKRSILLPGRMTWNYYTATFGKTTVTAGEKMLLEPSQSLNPDSIPPEPWIRCSRLATYDFEQHGAYDAGRMERAAHTGKFGLVLDTKLQYSPGLTMPVGLVTRRDSCWISSSGYFFFSCPPAENKVFLVMTCVRKGIPYKYKVTYLSNEKFHSNKWNRVDMSYLVPFPVDPEDLLQVYFMNYGGEECFIDDFEISLCQPIR